MSRQSEEVLLQVGNVRHKKNDGTLYLMGQRLGWMTKSKDSFGIDVKYADIKSQKVSPEGKAKIQLQIVQHDGQSTTFHFANPDGMQAQIRFSHFNYYFKLLFTSHPSLGTGTVSKTCCSNCFPSSRRRSTRSWRRRIAY